MQTPNFYPIKDMATGDPERRASAAARIIIKLYDRKGLTTPTTQVFIGSCRTTSSHSYTPVKNIRTSPTPIPVTRIRSEPLITAHISIVRAEATPRVHRRASCRSLPTLSTSTQC